MRCSWSLSLVWVCSTWPCTVSTRLLTAAVSVLTYFFVAHPVAATASSNATPTLHVLDLVISMSPSAVRPPGRPSPAGRPGSSSSAASDSGGRRSFVSPTEDYGKAVTSPDLDGQLAVARGPFGGREAQDGLVAAVVGGGGERLSHVLTPLDAVVAAAARQGQQVEHVRVAVDLPALGRQLVGAPRPQPQHVHRHLRRAHDLPRLLGRDLAPIVDAVGHHDGEAAAVAALGRDLGNPGHRVMQGRRAVALPALDGVAQRPGVGGERHLDVAAAAGESGEG